MRLDGLADVEVASLDVLELAMVLVAAAERRDSALFSPNTLSTVTDPAASAAASRRARSG